MWDGEERLIYSFGLAAHHTIEKWLPSFLAQLKQICKDYFDRMYQCESQKYDMEYECRKREFEVWWG